MNLPENRQWTARYTPPSHQVWTGRNDAEDNAYIHQTVHCIDCSQPLPELKEKSFGIVGFCSDEGVRRNFGRPGAAKGPQSLRENLGKLPVNLDPPFTIYDCGDIHCTDNDLESSQKALGKIIHTLYERRIHPVLIGGGHEIAWGTYQGMASAYPDANVGIINCDAHYDLRPLMQGGKGSSGTPFSQIATDRAERKLDFNYLCIGIQKYGNTRQLFQKARELHVETIFADDIYSFGNDQLLEKISLFVEKCDSIYLSVCLDVFEAAICPGVSAPQVLGLQPWQVIPLIREIASSGKSLCLEIAELSPEHDENRRSAKLGAALVCDYVHHIHS